MADTWFTSDFHLGLQHHSLLQRPFANTDEMNEAIVELMNSCVKQHDTLYFLGDFCLGSPRYVMEYRERLACKTIHRGGSLTRV